ncbi:hypothetical protein TWF679_005655 [Orbilia oligospora]|uniref:Uncharacterized protein n=1 Tax=Orbilia oligospora TaxID=2813651 RepID=A0A8H8VBJ2_ORBOL|nr:hypothetical protein TWF679_005655 [Orbilia oligospora]
MSRTIFYGASFAAFASASILTLTAITLPRWVSYTYETSSGPITQTYGLRHSCRTGPSLTNPTTICRPFPTFQDCEDSPHFCSLWKSTNYLMNLAVSIEVLTCLCFILILSSSSSPNTTPPNTTTRDNNNTTTNNTIRKSGWKYLVLLLSISVTCQLLAMSLVSYVYENDERFFVGWRLDVCWVLCMVSWGVGLVVTGLVGLVGWVLPEDGGGAAGRDAGREGYERLQ